MCRRVDLSRGVRPELVVVCGRHCGRPFAIEIRSAPAEWYDEPCSTRSTTRSTAVVAFHPLRPTSLVALGVVVEYAGLV